MAFEQRVIKAGSESDSSKNTLKMIGFKAVLCWHYIVLFSPILIAKTYTVEMQTLFTRQFPMYVSMALAFGLLMLFGRKLVGKDRPSRKLLIIVGMLGVFASVFSILVHPWPRPVRVASVLVLGPIEAVSMFLWFRYYARAVGDKLLYSFAVDMIFGGVAAFLICSFVEPINYVLASILPLVAMVSLDVNWPYSTEEEIAAREAREAEGCESASKRGQHAALFGVRMAVPRMVFAFVLGMVQGAFLFANVPLFIVCDPAVLGCGILVAGMVILFTPEGAAYWSITDRLHRIALLLFGFGLIGLILIREGSLWIVALLPLEMIILAGFNLVDFGGLVTSLAVKERASDSVSYVDSGRVLAYSGLALGLLAGYLLLSILDMSISSIIVMLCCGGLFVLMVTVLLPNHASKTDVVHHCTRAETGRCASGAASPCANAGMVDSLNALSLREADREEASLPAPLATEVAQQEKGDTVQQATWGETCDYVAEQYGLSRREKDVFMLIAKGRNAEFIQNELYISVHTVKTHMSHIYRKLGVHSSQELISLIEEHQAELSR